jgi:diguanylate cyclase (GGDEF)-like protein/putative nucleotidyltransferase with HDIG domain
MTANDNGSTEASIEQGPETSTRDDGDRATLSAEEVTAAGGGEDGRSIPRAFLVLRLASVVAIAGGLTLLVALDMFKNGWLVWAAMGLFLGCMALAGEVLLRWTQRMVRSERDRAHAIYVDRQAELQEIASVDDLTQLQNRRFFYQCLQDELEKAGRSRKQVSIAMIDVDDLKAINDEFGHQVGDVVLRQFARTLNRTAGQDQVTARLGGDEFAVIMPNADRREADQLAWRIWDQLGEAPVWENGHASIYLGVSIGIGGYPWGGTDLEEIIHWADAKLYANKLERKGFNQDRTGNGDNRLSAAVVEVLSTALDIRDNMTHRHARRVARMATAVAKEMGLDQHEVLGIEYAATLHDIGKIGVADSILRKAAPLDAEEWKDMRRHSELGYEILNGIDFLRDAAEIVWAHHERYDGKGYPRGLVGEEIPFGARVFGVVDAYDAMTSRRPYRQAMSREQACIEIARNAGTQFDRTVVESFLVIIRRSPEVLQEQDMFGPPAKKHPERERPRTTANVG